MVIILFKLKNKEKKSRFLEIFFLLTNLSMNIILEILFLTLSNIEVNFPDPKFI